MHLLGIRGRLCCFHLTLGRGTPCGCLWQIYVDTRGGLFHSAIAPLPTLCPGKRDRFLPFHAFVRAGALPSGPSHLLPAAPPSAPGTLCRPLGQPAMYLQNQQAPESVTLFLHKQPLGFPLRVGPLHKSEKMPRFSL